MRLIVFMGFFIALVPSIFYHPYFGVLIYSWLSFMSAHKVVWDFPTWLPLVMIVAIVTIVSWLFSKEPKRLTVNPTGWLIVAFMAWISLTTSVALNPGPAYNEWSQTMKSLLFVLITIALTTNRIRLHALLWVMAVSIGFYGLKDGLGTLVTGGHYQALGPPDTAISDNNEFGAGLVVALPLMNYVRINSGNRWVQLGWLGVMVASTLAIVGTYSRAAFLALIAIGFLFFLRSRRKMITAIAVSLVVSAVITFMPAQYMEKMHTIENYEGDASAMSRFDIWGVALKMAEELPLTGGGFKATESQSVVNRFVPGVVFRAVHNIFLAVLAQHGIIGFLLWIALPIVAWSNSRWITRHSAGRPEWRWADDLARMSQVAIVGYMVAGSFHNTQYWDYYFTIIGLVAAARTMMQRAILPQRLPAPPRPSPRLRVDA